MLTLEVTAVRDDDGAGLLEGVESGGHDGGGSSGGGWGGGLVGRNVALKYAPSGGLSEMGRDLIVIHCGRFGPGRLAPSSIAGPRLDRLRVRDGPWRPRRLFPDTTAYFARILFAPRPFVAHVIDLSPLTPFFRPLPPFSSRILTSSKPSTQAEVFGHELSGAHLTRHNWAGLFKQLCPLLVFMRGLGSGPSR